MAVCFRTSRIQPIRSTSGEILRAKRLSGSRRGGWKAGPRGLPDGGRVTRCSATVHFLHQFPLSLHRWTIVLDTACVLPARWTKFPLRVAVPRKAPARYINRSDPVPGSDSARSIAARRARWADQSSVLLFVAWPEKEAKRQSAGMHRLLELARRVRQLEKKVGQLSAPNT